MGRKQGKNKQKKHSAQASQQPLPPPPPQQHAGDRTNNNTQQQYPLPFPHSSKLPLPPKGGFVDNHGNYQKAYNKAIETSYEGFVFDGPDTKNSEGKPLFPHDKIRNALQTLEDAHIFRTDVTQPFGLGTKCAKTYVTRCLLGEPGTTYKYLGLRMFSHPWDASHLTVSGGMNTNKALQEALTTLSGLNDILTQRTETHLSDLGEKRKARRGVIGGPTTVKGRAKFDITLINRMETSDDLKPEPVSGKGRCTVSWHADSCLENYSTIGVYQTFFHSKGKTNHDEPPPDGKGWSVALRVAHDSEGPAASRRGTDIGSSVITDTPVLTTSLPSGTAYYMLDDFNHHHQHAVLAPETSAGGVRFSSTHRLLRLGHNVHFVIERCQSACAGFHKKGPKIWRSEQLLLTDIESEWIRQFYIQGSGHKANLWAYWKDPMGTLLHYWGQLETRTKQVIDWLHLAAEERCGIGSNHNNAGAPPSRAERKLRDKRKKAAHALAEITDRISKDVGGEDAHDSIYIPLAILLEERATMRRLWSKREKEHVFTRMDPEYRPLSPPLVYETTDASSSSTQRTQEEAGRSPLPEDLQHVAAKLRQWGLAYRSQNPSDLPEGTIIDTTAGKHHQLTTTTTTTKNNTSQEGGCDDHSKSLTWEGWGDKQFGLEMQKPWAEALLSGEKKIETRAYNLPSALMGKKILILESQPGKAGVSSLGNIIYSDRNGIDSQHVRILGWAVFDKVIEYREPESFEKDEELHLVTRDSGYGWNDGKTEVIYGWVCSDKKFYSVPEEMPQVSAFVRRMRSLYEIQTKHSENAEPSSAKANGRVKSSGRKHKKRKKNDTVLTGFSGQGNSRKKRNKKRY